MNKLLFKLINFIGGLLVITEIILRSFHSSICSSIGCRLVAQHVRFGDITILLLGLAVFLIMFNESLIDSMLVIALASEGYLVGYQLFRLNSVCLFCIIIASIFICLTILRSLDGHKNTLLGLACFLSVLTLSYLILPPNNVSNNLPDNRLILFYQRGCPHCSKIIRLCNKCKIPVSFEPANKYSFLRNLDIKEVPVLLINNKKIKEFLIGENKIRSYLTKITSINLNKLSIHYTFYSKLDSCQLGKNCK